MFLVRWALLLICLVLGFFPLPFFVTTILRGTKATISLQGKLENLHTARSPSFLGVLYRNTISFHTGAIAKGKRNTPLKMLIVYLNSCAISFNRLQYIFLVQFTKCTCALNISFGVLTWENWYLSVFFRLHNSVYMRKIFLLLVLLRKKWMWRYYMFFKKSCEK